jgi:hypothetical protein
LRRAARYELVVELHNRILAGAGGGRLKNLEEGGTK